LSQPVRMDELAALLREVWHDGFTLADVSVRQLSGAMSNHVFVVEHARGERVALLLRIYGFVDNGAGTTALFSRDREVAVAEAVAELQLGPPVLAVFTNGRIEQLLDGAPLTSQHMRSRRVSSAVAAAMACFHARTAKLKGLNSLWSRLRQWHVLATAAARDEQEGGASLHCVLDAAGRAVDELQTACVAWEASGRPGSGVVFAHCDLQHNNILLRPAAADDAVSVTLIDYEYSLTAPCGYDIANHFCEWAADYGEDADGGMLNYPLRYPGHADRLAFCAAYLIAMQLQCPNPAPRNISEDALALAGAVERYALASHLLWGLWGVIKSHQSSLDWDYLGYARQRLDEYRLHKARVEQQYGSLTIPV
jgi:choline/ethanolamine kinase